MISKIFLANSWLDSARARLLMLVMVGSFASIGAYFGYQKIGIVSASATINIGALGVLSWTESIPKKEDCDRGSTKQLLACYLSFARGVITSIEVPIENMDTMWRSLSEKYDIPSARKGQLNMPFVYNVEFVETAQVLTIVTRGNTEKGAVGLLEEVVDTIVRAHRDRVQKHRNFLQSLVGDVENNNLEDDQVNEFKEVKSAEILAMTAAINSAVQSTYETDYAVEPRLVPQSMYHFWLRVISGCVIGLIMFGFLTCLVRTLRVL